MKPSFQTMASIRFGYGLSPSQSPPLSVDAMLNQLAEHDTIAQTLPITGFNMRAEEEAQMGLLRRARRRKEAGAVEALKKANKLAVNAHLFDMRRSMGRVLLSEDSFRERLVRFWADHFSVAAKGKGLRFVTHGFIEDAIRPHITGRFSDLLRTASLHPAMLIYLDQVQSFGPNSKTGKKVGRGLNENLAREILELHSLGVGAGYAQVDVRQFAEALTGLFYNFRKGFSYRRNVAEPGAETVLGKSYGGHKGKLADIYEIMDDLAAHIDTATHIARKLVVHFVSDQPDAAHVKHVQAAFVDNDGDLMAVYTALLEHPAAWQNSGAKAKQPFDFMVSSMRALGVRPKDIENLSRKETRLYFVAPLQVMGQPWLQPSGPDGWPEPLDDWITPQGLAARVQWALVAAGLWSRQTAPAVFAETALAEMAGEDLRRLVGFSESRLEGVALVLASPAFNRR